MRGPRAKVFYGWVVAGLMGRDRFLIAMHAGMAVSFVPWLIGFELWSLGIFALTFGLFYGGWVATSVALEHCSGRAQQALHST